jgi:hypothetical protein
MAARIPAPPKGTGPSGKALWTSVLTDYELEQHEIQLLREMCRTVDTLDTLHAAVQADGAFIDGPHGRKCHPGITESRQLRIALARLAAAIRLPAGDDGDQPAGRRPQRRGSPRGVYAIGGNRDA